MTTHEILTAATVRRHLAVPLVLLASLAALLVGCGDDEGPSESADRAESHPFEIDVAAVPTDYELVAIGTGTDVAEWNSEMGSDEPLTVVEVDGVEVHARLVAWDPMEGALRYASRSGDSAAEEFVLDDGRPAAHGEGVDGRWNDLVIEVDDTVALVIASDGATREELIEFSAHLRSDGDRTRPPNVVDPPEGWITVGSVGADALLAMRSEPYPRTNAVPGPATGHAMGWVDRRPPPEYEYPGALTLAVLPASSADLDAIERSTTQAWEPGPAPIRVDVAGRPGVVVESGMRFGGTHRVLATHDADGALVVLNATGGVFPSVDELVALAGSVRQVGEDIQGELPSVSVRVDDCLKLSTMERVCTLPSGGRGGSIGTWDEDSEVATVDFPSFTLIVTPDTGAASVRATAGEQVAEAPLAEVPGADWDQARAGLLFARKPPGAFPSCLAEPPEPPPGSNLSSMRIDLLDAAGAPVGCISTM